MTGAAPRTRSKGVICQYPRRSGCGGRPIVLSICEWGKAQPWLWGKEVGGNLWRTTGDIQDRWAGKKEWKPGDCCSYGVVDIVDFEADLIPTPVRHWNDPDMLEVGNGGLTDVENVHTSACGNARRAPDCRQRPEKHASGIRDILTTRK